MKTFTTCAALAVSLCLGGGTLPAADGHAANVVGWRGDATGCYPQANPPITWGRVSKNIVGVTAQAKKPGEKGSGDSLEDGAIHEWLVLGPVVLPPDGEVPTEMLPGEAQFAPDENQQNGPLAWKLVKTDSSFLNFASIFGKASGSGAYAHAYIYSPSGLPLVGRQMQHGGIKCWLNGQEVCSRDKAWSATIKLNVNKGWNSLLLRVWPDDSGWYTSFSVSGGPPWQGQDKNIAWACRTPNSGNASPIIVGDTIFVTSEPYDLCCVNKNDGTLLWVRSNNYFETLAKADKEKLPEVAALAARLEQINALWGTATAPDDKLLQEKRQLEKRINEAMKKFDPKQFAMGQGQDVGYAGMTPVSDGKHVWVWFATGVSACYDRAGNRLWTHVANDTKDEHGFASSPTLASDKFVVHMAETIALDARTGAVAWRLPGSSYAGSLQTLSLNGETLVLTPTLDIVRARDGKVLLKPAKSTVGGCGQLYTPVVSEGMIYTLDKVLALPASAAEPFQVETVRSFALNTKGYPKFFGEWYTSSPVVHQGLGLMYCCNSDGTLSVVDLKTGQVLYTRLVDVNLCYDHNMKAARGLGASLAIAGKYVYIFGNVDTAVVLEASREFKQVAKNRIESYVDPNEWWAHQETSVASPVFDGNKLYYRAETTLYCIGTKAEPAGAR